MDGQVLTGHSYEHHAIDEPAILLGGAFMSDVVESAEEQQAQAQTKAQM